MTDTLDATAVAAVARLAAAGSEPFPADPDQAYIVQDADGAHRLIDTWDPDYAPCPRSSARRVEADDVDSLAAYLDRLADNTALEVWADRRAGEVVAVLNAPAGPGETGWADHRAVLKLRTSPDWAEWRELSGRLVPHEQMAEFLEDHQRNLVEPDAATAIEIAQSIRGAANARWESTHMLQNGQRAFEWREEVEAKAGRKGQLEIPTRLRIAVPPYLFGRPFDVTALFKFQIRDGRLFLGVKLLDPDLVEDAAFGETAQRVADALAEKHPGVPVLAGGPGPAAPRRPGLG